MEIGLLAVVSLPLAVCGLISDPLRGIRTCFPLESAMKRTRFGLMETGSWVLVILPPVPEGSTGMWDEEPGVVAHWPRGAD